MEKHNKKGERLFSPFFYLIKESWKWWERINGFRLIVEIGKENGD